MTRQRYLTTVLLAGALAVAGYAYYRAQARQAATLARITALEARLIASNKQRAQAAGTTVFGLREAVRKNHNQAQDVAVLRQAQQIQARTKTLLDTLHQLRQAWQAAGHEAALRQLPTQLAQYVLFMQPFTPDSPLTNHASTRTEAASWLGEFDPAIEPHPVALALLTKLETQVRQLEAEALIGQTRKVFFEGVFEKISVCAVPVSREVASGAVYQAQLLLVFTLPVGQMHFSVDGRTVPVSPATGQGVVQFTVPAARPGQPDTMRAEWQGRVRIPWAAGIDTVLTTTVPYFIVKPSHP